MRLTLACIILLLSACGGGGGGGSTSPTSSVDFGTAKTVDDSFAVRIKNADSGMWLTIAGQSQAAGTFLDQAADTSTIDESWHVMPMGGSSYNIENLLTHQLIGISAASTSAGARALQWADNGTQDHLWTFYLLTDGNYLIRNSNSGLYLETAASGGSTVIDQGTRTATGTACRCQEWALTITSDAAYPAPMAVTGSGVGVHDPNMIQAPDGTYWLYGTHNTLASSTDLSTFVSFANGDINPDFSWWATENTTAQGGRTDIWAPSVLAANGTYYQYYSIPIYDTPSQVGTNDGPEAVIALATSASPTGPWTDAGQIVASCGHKTGCTTTFNAIDPAPFIDSAGNWWMSFGSWEDGIHLLQLDPSTGKRLASNTSEDIIASRPNVGEEGSFIFPYVIGGTQYYFFFASINTCCNGTSSTYRIIVGRSTAPTGPYVDRGGTDLLQGGGTILLSSHSNIFGPGGQSVMATNAAPLLVYHYYDGNANGVPKLGLNQLQFDSAGWPYVQ
jgi:arabinan endo-1,5-alpha-L-arabinosidase